MVWKWALFAHNHEMEWAEQTHNFFYPVLFFWATRSLNGNTFKRGILVAPSQDDTLYQNVFLKAAHYWIYTSPEICSDHNGFYKNGFYSNLAIIYNSQGFLPSQILTSLLQWTSNDFSGCLHYENWEPNPPEVHWHQWTPYIQVSSM